MHLFFVCSSIGNMGVCLNTVRYGVPIESGNTVASSPGDTLKNLIAKMNYETFKWLECLDIISLIRLTILFFIFSVVCSMKNKNNHFKACQCFLCKSVTCFSWIGVAEIHCSKVIILSQGLIQHQIRYSGSTKIQHFLKFVEILKKIKYIYLNITEILEYIIFVHYFGVLSFNYSS